MMDSELKAGDIVAGLEPDEHVAIRQVRPFGGKALIKGVGVTSRREIRRPLDQDRLTSLTKVRGIDYSYDGDAAAFLLGVEARRIRIAHQFDPLFAVNSSVVDILPHQIEAVYRYLLTLPRIRFLLALFEVLPRGEDDWRLVSALLGERETLRIEGRRVQVPTEPTLFD